MGKGRHNDRICVGTGVALLPGALAIRFARSPDGGLVPDLAEKLPGRGAWIAADSTALERALKKRSFERAFGAGVVPEPADPDAFTQNIDTLLRERALDRLGLARKAGEVVTGADSVARARDRLVGYVHPAGISADSIRKLHYCLEESVRENHIELPVDAEAFGAAIGLPGVVHVGLLSGRVSKAALWELHRWRAFSAPDLTNLH